MNIALVTGASGGIGESIVKKLVDNDYFVIAQYCSDKSTVEKLATRYSNKVMPIYGDFLTTKSTQEFAKKVNEKYKLNLLINNAGIACEKLFIDTTNDEIERLMNVNLFSAMIISREVAKHMVWDRKGCIVNISSIWGEVGGCCEVAYSATKGGLIAFTKALSKELGQSNIRVNCITPGFIDTKMNKDLTIEDRKQFCQSITLARIGCVDEVAEAVAFLASDKASYITGQVLGVNGGIL